MKKSKVGLYSIISIAVLSLLALVFIQFRILQRDIENNESQMESAIPSILMDMYDNMNFNTELDGQMAKVVGTEEFSFSRDSNPTDPVQQIVKKELDRVLSLNYPSLNYVVDGFTSNEYGCLIHTHHGANLPKAKKVLAADNHLCFCVITRNTLDIAMTYSNKNATVLGESSPILLITILLMLAIIGAFLYLIRTINRQKKLSDLKRDFINNLTHEFKTPIFSISLAVESLRSSKQIIKSDKMNSYLDLIGKESSRLQGQVDKILQIAKLDSGNLTLEKKAIDLHTLIKKVVEDFKIIIDEKVGSCALNLQAEKHIVTADETHLRNVIFNLIDNAQKYSDLAPAIEVTTHDHETGVVLSIKDNGIGIKKEVQKYVFDQFYRAQRGDVHDVKGFGLGLSYVKRMVEAHKGKIGLISEPRKGSEFTITLPITQ